MAVFWQTDKIKQPHKRVFSQDPDAILVFHRSQKKMPKERICGPVKGIIWGSILAFFGKRGKNCVLFEIPS
jgi:hypothetical protein